MTKLVMRITLAAAFAVTALSPVAFAANARHPYRHINKANDKGGDTGDAAVARLNQQQLDQIKTGH